MEKYRRILTVAIFSLQLHFTQYERQRTSCRASLGSIMQGRFAKFIHRIQINAYVDNNKIKIYPAIKTNNSLPFTAQREDMVSMGSIWLVS